MPFKPNPMKYRYLLQNKYPQISSVHGLLDEGGEEATTSTSGPAKIESPKRNLLGDFTMYKVNKEFENF